MKIEEIWKKGDKYECPFCLKQYTKKGIATHIILNHTDKKWVKQPRDRKTESWNKGKTKITDERIQKSSKKLSEKFKGDGNPFKGKHHTAETKEIVSKKLSKNNKGGRCKWYEFVKHNGEIVKVQGTWELRFAKILEKIDENWIKISMYHKEHSFVWTDDLLYHTYTPDFYSPKLNKYFEVKGYWWGDDKKKMKLVFEQNLDLRLEIIDKHKLELMEQTFI